MSQGFNYSQRISLVHEDKQSLNDASTAKRETRSPNPTASQLCTSQVKNISSWLEHQLSIQP